jgi:hypothetical protein
LPFKAALRGSVNLQEKMVVPIYVDGTIAPIDHFTLGSTGISLISDTGAAGPYTQVLNLSGWYFRD